MSLPARPDDGDLPLARERGRPSALVWTIAGFALMAAYAALLGLLRPAG